MKNNDKQIADVIVVGGGASGMVAAIAAARAGASVIILEHMDCSGKKILATGNGKCNYTNRMQGVTNYRGENPAFVIPVFEQFSMEETVDFFKDLGIYPYEKNGYFYPASEQAASVVSVLMAELKRWNVSIFYNVGIRSIKKGNNQFIFETKEETFKSKACILAAGGKSAKKTGSDGSGFIYAKNFGHRITELYPALVQLMCKETFFKKLAGIRTQATVKLFADDKFITEDTGELQLTDYGISGIPVFQISRFVAQALAGKQNVKVIVDFFPALKSKELMSYLLNRFEMQKEETLEEALLGMFNSKLIPVLLEEATLSTKVSAEKLSKEQIKRLTDKIKEFEVTITNTKSFDNAQVTAGGVDTTEIKNETLESKIVSGLYFAGEMIDIDGKCGGYNLQWAWSSGMVAGRSAAKEIRC